MAQKITLEYDISEYSPDKEPFYVDVNGETNIFRTAYQENLPVMLKGPTGCGKSRFVERMAHELNKDSKTKFPLVTVPCHEDLNADDLKGRHLMNGEYMDGPALVSVKSGGILYLDEIVEARNDTTVVIHPLADHRRSLAIEKLGKVYEAPDSFMLVISYNPGYQRKIKDLKQSTKQRFVAINFDYPSPDVEKGIVEHESGVDGKTAEYLTEIGTYLRNLKGKGLDEGASTRLLINAGKLIKNGIEPAQACEIALLNPITDDIDVYQDIRKGLEDVVQNFFP
ncbi:AAA family ATPase [Candidatus Pacearchaeota archaeon]|jgi:nitric oxide reductase NorQ protein|nr:AAA family ATPase [Candidatus Pacearchaeota archaeon]|tara:strand:- start:7614 stop:8459 length:846 start_codon:yes stop_codon:yes gene_type:complete